jgi:ubiquitin
MGTMFLGNPELEMRIYGEDYQDNFMKEDEEYEYDEFLGAWIRKLREKRSHNPKVIARRIKRDKIRISKGLAPKYPELLKATSKKRITLTPLQEDDLPLSDDIFPLTKSEAQAHRNVNKAIQEELKTKQEELKTIGLSKKVAQEDLKAENQKAKTQLAGAGTYLMWGIGIVGGLYVLGKVFNSGSKLDQNLTPKVG